MGGGAGLGRFLKKEQQFISGDGLTEGIIAKLREDNSALADFIQLDPNKPGQGKLAIQGPLTQEALTRIQEILLESGITVE